MNDKDDNENTEEAEWETIEPDDDTETLTPDGQKIDYYADDGVPLVEKLLKKDPNLERDDTSEPVEEPGFWARRWRDIRRLLER